MGERKGKEKSKQYFLLGDHLSLFLKRADGKTVIPFPLPSKGACLPSIGEPHSVNTCSTKETAGMLVRSWMSVVGKVVRRDRLSSGATASDMVVVCTHHCTHALSKCASVRTPRTCSWTFVNESSGEPAISGGWHCSREWRGERSRLLGASSHTDPSLAPFYPSRSFLRFPPLDSPSLFVERPPPPPPLLSFLPASPSACIVFSLVHAVSSFFFVSIPSSRGALDRPNSRFYVILSLVA